MKHIITVVILISGIYLCSCNSKTQTQKRETVCDSIEISASEHLVNAALWFQKSAEMRSVYYQCYSYAKIALDNQIKYHKGKTKNAVIIDIDETVLDNSPYQGMLIQKGLSFTSQTWKEWTKLAKAKALPGAVEFTNYAKSKGVVVFYVTNRDDEEKEATIKNMNTEKFPYADEHHIFFRVNKESSKIPRYDSISKTYQILLIVGDNLRDFDEIFGKRVKNYGFDAVDSMKNQFGEKFIILPNPMYGEWEKAIYGGKYPNEKESNKLRKHALQSF
jgi:5'-nucleotidase (lipoprotein e(P4) family)